MRRPRRFPIIKRPIRRKFPLRKRPTVEREISLPLPQPPANYNSGSIEKEEENRGVIIEDLHGYDDDTIIML
jgi:hypothetical protein